MGPKCQLTTSSGQRKFRTRSTRKTQDIMEQVAVLACMSGGRQAAAGRGHGSDAVFTGYKMRMSGYKMTGCQQQSSTGGTEAEYEVNDLG